MKKEPKSVKDLFADALEKDPKERIGFLDKECGGDKPLRAQVQALLDAYHKAPDFLEKPYGSAVNPDPHKPPQFMGDFKIIREIGRGGMGAVFLADQLSLNRKVALKILPSHLSFFDDIVLKFRREAEAGGRQSHPGIVSIYAIGEHQGIHYIAQELVGDGFTLFNKVEKSRGKKELPPGYFRETARIIRDTALAMEHAHNSGVIHRDIKPSNILLNQSGEPKVTDFGLAKVEDALALSRTGDFAGTPYYMSPEQVTRRKLGIDKRTDIYSLGVTLYEMLTLKPPFEGKTSIEVMKKICVMDPVDPHKTHAHAPRDLSLICLKAMEKSPEKRYQTMKEFSEDLTRFLHGDVILAKPAGLKTLIWKQVKRNPLLSTSVGVALLSLLCFIGYELFISIPKLKHERNKALAAEKKAEEQAKIIQDNYDRIIRLSDLKYLSELREDADKLWPAYPENIEKLEAWMKRADDLLDRLEEHQLTLKALQKKALPSNQDNEPEAWVFEDLETGWWHDTLSELVSGLKALEDKRNGLRARVLARLTFARTVEEKSIKAHQTAWDDAIRSIQDKKECPQYHGLKINTQLGFVPVGRDPDSGLWEFAHLQTGDIPKRNQDGKLILTEKMGLVFVLIPGGSFQMGAVKPSKEHPMGSPNADPQAGPDEEPVHRVTLKPFLISKYEMTQGQWLRIGGFNPSSNKPNWFGTVSLLYPVEQLNWRDCMDMMHKLKLRLPSESEWEYAARAGSSTIFWTGDHKQSLQGAANLADLFLKTNGGPKAWPYEEGLNDGFKGTAPVGSLAANGFGLHDVHGNVFEWCEDSFARYELTPIDGTAYLGTDASLRILRGGAWDRIAIDCRSAMRKGDIPDFHSSDQGLRPAASME